MSNSLSFDDDQDDFARPSIQRTVSAATAPAPDMGAAISCGFHWPSLSGYSSALEPEPEPTPISQPQPNQEPNMTSKTESTVSTRFKVCSLLVARGPMSTVALADAVGETPETLTKNMYTWKVKGLIERHADGTSSITEAGRAYVNGDTASGDTGLAQMFKERSAAKKQTKQKATRQAKVAAPEEQEQEQEQATETEQNIGLTTWLDGTYTLTVDEQHVPLSLAGLKGLWRLIQAQA